MKRVLIYRLGSLGDTVVALPCLHLIARRFPNAERIMLTNFPVHAKAPASASVIGNSGLVHRYMRYGAKTRNPFEIAALLWRLRRLDPDVLVYVMPWRTPAAIRRDALFFRLAGIRHIIGLPSAAELTHVFDDRTNLYESEASRLARSIAELGDANVESARSWDLRLTSSERDKAQQVLSRLETPSFIVCGPGTKMQSKDWGAKNWAGLLGRLSATLHGHGLVLVGAKEERQLCEQVGREWQGPVLNVCGALTPRETAAVIERGDLFLGPDSGPMHLAHAVGAPCAIAFSARSQPGIWFPPGKQHEIVYRRVSCSGCHLEACIEEKQRCLTSISIDAMYQAALSACRQPSGAGLRPSVADRDY